MTDGPQTTEDDKLDAAFEKGRRAVYLANLAESLRGLGRESPEWAAHGWLLEREAAVATLRSVCEEHGDNEWDDNLHLSDVIEKHLGKYLNGR